MVACDATWGDWVAMRGLAQDGEDKLVATLRLVNTLEGDTNPKPSPQTLPNSYCWEEICEP